jgi:hypothetical protein
VRAGKDGAPITDGVFRETKEFLAAYWIVDVESPERAYPIAGGAGSGGTRLNMPIEVRQVMTGRLKSSCESGLYAGKARQVFWKVVDVENAPRAPTNP